MEAGHHGADGSVQPSLLRGIVMEKPVPRAFDLGMIDFVESTAFEKEKENRFRPLSLKKSRSNAPPPKRPCLHPSENQAVNNDPDRFDFSKDDAYSDTCMCICYMIRATGASMMFQAGVREKIVQERTGHRSLEALRMYERTTTTQHMEVSRVLSAQKDQKYATCNSSLPAKQSDTAGGVCFSTIFGTTTNCVINVNLAGQPPKLDN